MKLTFRPVTVEEYPLAEQFKRATAIAATGRDDLFDTWFPAERPYAGFLASIQAFDPEGCAMALLGDTLVGQINLRIHDDGHGHLNNIYLLDAWRGKGLGAQMDAYAMRFFTKHGAKLATLKTNPAQPKLIAFYERMGWVARPGLDDFGFVTMERTVS